MRGVSVITSYSIHYTKLYEDASEKTVKAFDDETVGDYAIEGEYVINGVKCRPAFALVREHVKQYTPEFAEKISTAPAETIRRISSEFA